MDYEFWLSPEAIRTLLGSNRRLRTKIEDILKRVSSSPFEEPDFRERSPDGRIYDVKCFGEIIVTYWVDHAVKEVRIIAIEIA